jgi:hypothetical protein
MEMLVFGFLYCRPHAARWLELPFVASSENFNSYLDDDASLDLLSVPTGRGYTLRGVGGQHHNGHKAAPHNTRLESQPHKHRQHPDAAADVLPVLQGRLGTPRPSGFPERTWFAWDRRG